MKTQLVSFRCPEALQAQFKEFALASETTMSQLLIDCIKELTDSKGNNDNQLPTRKTILLDHTAELAKIQINIVKLMVTIEESGDSISASECLTSIIDDLLRVKMMILFSETMENSGFKIYSDRQTE